MSKIKKGDFEKLEMMEEDASFRSQFARLRFDLVNRLSVVTYRCT